MKKAINTTKTTAKATAKCRAERIAALAAIVTQIANADAANTGGDWGSAGSLGHVEEQLGQLADFLSGSEEGSHAATTTKNLRGDAGFAGFPEHVDTNGLRYYFTGKEGRNIKTGRPVREYQNTENDRDSRLWADGRGRFEMDD